MMFTLVKNIEPNVTETTLPMVVATPEPRLVKLVLTKEGDVAFAIGNAKRRATSYDVHIKLQGAAGLVAHLSWASNPQTCT